MRILLIDNGLHSQLAPLTLTRPVAHLRFGIFTFQERWERLCKRYEVEAEFGYQTEQYLGDLFPGIAEVDVVAAGNALITPEVFKMIRDLEPGKGLRSNGRFVAAKTSSMEELDGVDYVELEEEVLMVERSWHLFQLNDKAINEDFDIVTHKRVSALLSDSNKWSGKRIFLEPGAKVECSTLNAEGGPIYIGADAEVMEGCLIRGPFVLGDHSVLKLGAKIYGATTIGPHCKVGGEVNNSVILGYSNKAHDGFLGNSVIGEWCNLGADTNTSNLKNNYGLLRIHDYTTGKAEQTDIQFCGVLMGDHSKTGINTMLNTGTVVGVFANIFGGDFPPKYIPSFNWGVNGEDKFRLDKAYEVAQRVMSRRDKHLSSHDEELLAHLHRADS